METQTVFIVDDEEGMRDIIKSLVEESVGLSAKTFASAKVFLDQYEAQQSGCLILDIQMAHISGLALQSKLSEMGSRVPIIFITGYGDVDMAVKALKDGAFDFIQKPFHNLDLIGSINGALEYSMKQTEKVHAQQYYENIYNSMTQREREVLVLMLGGLSSKAIAQKLDISHRTVDVHRCNILKKSHVNNVAELAKIANVN
jgi:FixJ family two-component response regulator